MPDRWEERFNEYSRLLDKLTPKQREQYDRAVGEVYKAQDDAEDNEIRAARDAEWQAAWDANGLGPKTPEELRVYREEAAQVDREQRDHERAQVTAICRDLICEPLTPSLVHDSVAKLLTLFDPSGQCRKRDEDG